MRGCPRRRDKAGGESHGPDIFPQSPEFSKFVGAGGFFCVWYPKSVYFLDFTRKIQEIRAWEKKDADMPQKGIENHGSETKIAQAMRPGRFFVLFYISRRSFMQLKRYAFFLESRQSQVFSTSVCSGVRSG